MEMQVGGKLRSRTMEHAFVSARLHDGVTGTAKHPETAFTSKDFH